MTVPLVSVIMPALNRAAYIGAAIASVQAQTYRDWELIVSDDGSTDETCEVVGALADRDPRIRLTRNPGPHGPGAARNHAIAEARGDWLAFLDSDDLWDAGKLRAFAAETGARPVIVASDHRTVDHDKGTETTLRDYLLGEMVPWWSTDPVASAAIPCARILEDFAAIAETDVILAMTIGGGMWIHTSSAMVRADCFHQIGGFDPSLPRAEDFDLWIRLCGLGRVAFIDQILATYDVTGRDGATGGRYQTGQNHSPYVDAYSHLRLMRRIAARRDLTPACRALLRHRFAQHHRFCASRARNPLHKAWHHLAARTGLR
jgi:glycosyltransferase involved in cell wall biosynthesis